MRFQKRLFLVLFGFSSFYVISQQINYSGIVVDSLRNPVEFANITAIPNSDAQQIRYTTTNTLGNFNLLFQKNETYEITVSHLGFFIKKFSLSISKPFSEDIVLQERVEQLTEVTIDYTPPITSKKDTITYDTDAFVNGKERKLREVLKKLPGIEVDREGNVTAQGKKITKVLVDGKLFFTGNSKLAVNNIPADAVGNLSSIKK